MLLAQPIACGAVRGTMYTFEKINDVLPLHTHGPKDVHVTIVARGRFRMHGSFGEREVGAGAFVDWEPGVSHEFIALTDDARIYNLVKGQA